MENQVVALYCDGGVCGRNPSLQGGSWAFCHVDAAGERVKCGSGFVTPADVHYSLTHISNNTTELLAAVHGLEALPEGWSGDVYTDSNVTLLRLTRPTKWVGVPMELRNRAMQAVKRLGRLTFHLLGGHPTSAELAAGLRAGGKLVSEHNVFCDTECCRVIGEFQKAQKK